MSTKRKTDLILGDDMKAWEDWNRAVVTAGLDLREAIDGEDDDALDVAVAQWDHIIVRRPKRAPRPGFRVRPIRPVDEPADDDDHHDDEGEAS